MGMTGQEIYSSLTYDQKTFFLALIVEHEYGGDWNSGWTGTNEYNNAAFGDPFTIGIASWCGNEGYILLKYYMDNYPSVYADMPQTWKNAVSVGSGSSFWYDWNVFTQADINQFKLCAANHPVDFIQAQVDLIFEDVYRDGNFCSWFENLYSNNPTIRPDVMNDNTIRATFAYVSDVMLSGAGNSGVNAILRSHGKVGDGADWVSAQRDLIDYWGSDSRYGSGWTQRFNDDINWISNWDGVSGKEIPGYYTPSGNGNKSGTAKARGEVSYFKPLGNIGILGLSGGQMTLYKMSDGFYYPRTATTSDSGVVSPTSSNDLYQHIMQCINYDRYRYGYATSTQPWITGHTDCSSWIISIANRIAPTSPFGQWGATSTGDWVDPSRGNEILWDGDYGETLPYDVLRCGDCILEFGYSRRDETYFPYYGHVELFLGTESQGNKTGYELWGAGRSPCPNAGGFGYEYRTAQEYYDSGGCYPSSQNHLYVVRPKWGTDYVDWSY